MWAHSQVPVVVPPLLVHADPAGQVVDGVLQPHLQVPEAPVQVAQVVQVILQVHYAVVHVVHAGGHGGHHEAEAHHHDDGDGHLGTCTVE